jgi:DNA-binding transcriptional MerR regulator
MTQPPDAAPDAPPDAEPEASRARRIDDLARETGCTVDTIRYYQREGLLPPARRDGRHRVYGPEHVERLERIRELQGRRFSLAAIRALVSGDEQRLEGIFTDEGERFRYSFAELVERSGATPGLAEVLQEAGILRDPLEFGRVAYDGDDLDVLRAMATLERAGIPVKVIRAIGRIYAEGIEATQRRIVDTFGFGGDLEWAPGELDEFRRVAGTSATALLPSMRRLVDYTHHRTLQRLTLDAVAQAAPPPGDPDATGDLPVTGDASG